MQKSLLTLFCFFAILFQTSAKEGYRIVVKVPGVKDSMAYLAHYFGEPLPKIYKTDSARFDKNGVAVFESKPPARDDEKFIGGIYMILLSNKSTYFEFLLNNGDDFILTADLEGLPYSLSFKNSSENEHFLEYVKFLKDFGEKQESYNKEIAAAKTKADTTAINKKYEPVGKSLLNFRLDYTKKYPGSLLANIFNAMSAPEVPKDKEIRPDGTVDSMFSYTYYKSHYWDKFPFNDDRIINTPIYNGKLEEYVSKLVLPIEDSVTKEADMLLAKARPSKELFKYTLWWLTRFAETSKIMGMDAVFVYLVENYYMKGDAFWLDNEQLKKYIDRAHDIAPNVIGNLAPEINLQDISNSKVFHSLHAVKAKYTLVIFWAPDCGHCQKEIPQIDSLYRAVLKGKGLKIYSVKNSGTMEEMDNMFKKTPTLREWTNVHDPERKSKYRADYDIYSTPVIYLLDEKKIIRGKRIDHSNIMSLIEMLEKKEAHDKKDK